MSKSSTGSFTSETGDVTVIDMEKLPDKYVIQVKTVIECDCPYCNKEARHEVVVKIDIARYIQEVVKRAVTGAFGIPAGAYEALVVHGYRSDFISGVMRKIS